MILWMLLACGPAPVVELLFEGRIATVANSPLGLDEGVLGEEISGSLSYAITFDTNLDDEGRGVYDQAGVGGLDVTLGGARVQSSGYGRLVLTDGNTDIWRYSDGLPNDGGVMSVDGTEDVDLQFYLSVSDSSGEAMSSDELDERFPFAEIADFPHTFSIRDLGGTVLLQISTVEVVAP